MFRFLSMFFQRSREIEATLLPTPESRFGGKGEIEIETFSDGSGSIEASLKHCGLPDGSQVEVYCGEQFVTSLVVSGGYAKSVLPNGPGEDEPLAAVGDEGSFRHAGATIFRGTFRPD